MGRAHNLADTRNLDNDGGRLTRGRGGQAENRYLAPPTGRALEIAEAKAQAKRRRWGKARAPPGEAWVDDSEEEDGHRRDDGGRGEGVARDPAVHSWWDD